MVQLGMPYVKIFLMAPPDDDDVAAALAAGMLAATTAAAAPPPLDGRVWAATGAWAATASADGAAELLLSEFGANTCSSPKDVPAALSSAAKMSL